ncbi:unnamed protein product, partial [Amoebophrya sp. A120]
GPGGPQTPRPRGRRAGVGVPCSLRGRAADPPPPGGGAWRVCGGCDSGPASFEKPPSHGGRRPLRQSTDGRTRWRAPPGCKAHLGAAVMSRRQPVFPGIVGVGVSRSCIIATVSPIVIAFCGGGVGPSFSELG